MEVVNKQNLARGKLAEGNEWVKGYHVQVGEYHYILSGKLDISTTIPTFEKYLVDPNTIGEYIGSDDKNKEPLFTGDIVKIISRSDEIATIEWDNFSARYILSADGVTYDFDCIYAEDLEVIGNIVDGEPQREQPEMVPAEVFSKEAVLSLLRDWPLANMDRKDVENLIGRVEDMPITDPDVHGYWIPHKWAGTMNWSCSQCHTEGSPQWRRCPVCEAKMDGAERKASV